MLTASTDHGTTNNASGACSGDINGSAQARTACSTSWPTALLDPLVRVLFAPRQRPPFYCPPQSLRHPAHQRADWPAMENLDLSNFDLNALLRGAQLTLVGGMSRPSRCTLPSVQY